MNSLPRPPVAPLDWIFIGKKRGTHAVVGEVTSSRVMVVYVNDNHYAIAEWVVWNPKGYWAFEHTSPSGIYAEKDQRLTHPVAVLRAGRRK